MIEALLAILHERWRPIPEVWVTRPVKGVVDLLLEPDAVREPLVAVEAQSGLQRLEQQIRWAHAKSEALGEACQRPVSQLLLLRSTRKTRAVATEHVATIRAAYPGSTSAVVEALSGVGAWPGPALVMCDVDLGAARIRPSPPRGVTIGR
jgi:hypothetical protein